VTHYTRDQIGLREPRGRYRLDAADVDGVALHWPGTKIRLTTPAACMAALRSYQRLHMDTDAIAEGGASDIAYQIAISQAGDWYQLRGLRHRSGANGDADVNRRYGAFLLLVAIGEEPTAAMVRTVRERVGRFVDIFPRAVDVVGHQDVRPAGTQCPGGPVMRLVELGRFAREASAL